MLSLPTVGTILGISLYVLPIPTGSGSPAATVCSIFYLKNLVLQLRPSAAYLDQLLDNKLCALRLPGTTLTAEKQGKYMSHNLVLLATWLPGLFNEISPPHQNLRQLGRLNKRCP